MITTANTTTMPGDTTDPVTVKSICVPPPPRGSLAERIYDEKAVTSLPSARSGLAPFDATPWFRNWCLNDGVEDAELTRDALRGRAIDWVVEGD